MCNYNSNLRTHTHTDTHSHITDLAFLQRANQIPGLSLSLRGRVLRNGLLRKDLKNGWLESSLLVKYLQFRMLTTIQAAFKMQMLFKVKNIFCSWQAFSLLTLIIWSTVQRKCTFLKVDRGVKGQTWGVLLPHSTVGGSLMDSERGTGWREGGNLARLHQFTFSPSPSPI